MPSDIFLEYLVDSTSSMPIYLDEDLLTELEDSWLWRHITPGFFEDAEEDVLILNWTTNTLAEPDVGINEADFAKNLATAIKSEEFLANVRAINRRCGLEDLRRQTLFGLEYVLLSGKVGDPEEFLDTNILPNLDAVKLLYHDWIALKERSIKSNTQLCPSLHDPPFSNVTNRIPQSTKRRVEVPEALSVVKRSKHASTFTVLPCMSIEMSFVPRLGDGKMRLTAIDCGTEFITTSNCQVLHSVDGNNEEDNTKIEGTRQVMQESEIQHLMKILEEAMEHVADSEDVTTDGGDTQRETKTAQLHSPFKCQTSPIIPPTAGRITHRLSPSVRSIPSSLLCSVPSLSRCSSTSSTSSSSTDSSTSSSQTSISRCSSISSIPSMSSLSSSSTPIATKSSAKILVQGELSEEHPTTSNSHDAREIFTRITKHSFRTMLG